MLCYSDIDAKIIVTDICFQEVAAVHVACIVIAIYWCTYFYIESTGMLFPPKPTTPHPLHDWAHCHLCIFSLGSAQVQPINNKSIYGVIACLYKQNNTQHAKDKRQWADEMEKRQTSYEAHLVSEPSVTKARPYGAVYSVAPFRVAFRVLRFTIWPVCWVQPCVFCISDVFFVATSLTSNYCCLSLCIVFYVKCLVMKCVYCVNCALYIVYCIIVPSGHIYCIRPLPILHVYIRPRCFIHPPIHLFTVTKTFCVFEWRIVPLGFGESNNNKKTLIRQ